MPGQDPIARQLRRFLPEPLALRLSRWKNIAFMMCVYQLAKRRPEFVKKGLLGKVRAELGPDCDIATDYTPKYNPWEQRVCLVPDSDLFRAIKERRASVVTGEIEMFTERGIRLKSGRELEADIIVTATGLVLQMLGGAEIVIDGSRVDPGATLAYKGVMISGVPNMASVFGYINASWTLKADLICGYVCRLLNHMDRKGASQVTPRAREEGVAPFVEGFSPGYIQRALTAWPKQGAAAPWRVNQNYIRDLISLKWSRIDDPALEFSIAPRSSLNDR